VGDVATRRAICCSADEDVRSALAKMGEAKVRLLPVVDADRKLEGLLSMDDVVDRTRLKAPVKGNGPTPADIVSTLKKLYAVQLPTMANKGATP
jgi:CBS domain-containing protein